MSSLFVVDLKSVWLVCPAFYLVATAHFLQPLPWPSSSGPGLTEGLVEVAACWLFLLEQLSIGWHPPLLALRALPAACSLNIPSTSWMRIWQDLNIREEAWGEGALLWCLWGGGFQQEGFKPAAIPAERHWHQALHFDSFYFKLSSISLLGKGRREAGEVAMVCGESGDAGTVGKPEASWQGCVEFLGIWARKFKVKAREFSGWSGR